MASTRFSGLQAFTDRRAFLMLALGYSSGLPFLLVFSTLSAWLREVGISRTEIGFLSYLALAYTFKFLWAPIVDAFDVPLLSRLVGRRRAWMIAAQLTVAVGLIGVGVSDPAKSLMAVAAFAFLVALASATQDVVIDGWRIDAVETERQGAMAAAYQLGYRFALISAGAGALYVAEFASWGTAYFTMAALMGVGLAASFLAPMVDRHKDGKPAARGWSFAAAVADPLQDLFRRKGAKLVLILAVVALYRLPDFVSGVMANPLYIDLKFSKIDIANVSKLYGVWVGIAGAFAGGYAIAKLGLYRSLVIGAMVGAASNLMFCLLAVSGTNHTMLVGTISIDNFCGGFAGTVLIAYMSGLTGPGYAATQYALLSSLYALPGKLVGGLSGVMVDSFGYPVFFAITAAVGIPVTLMCLYAGRIVEEDRSAPEATASEPEAGAAPAPATATR